MEDPDGTDSVANSHRGLVAIKSRKYRLLKALGSRLSSLEKRLLLAVVILTFLTLILLIVISVLTAMREDPVPLCYSQDCIRSAAMLLDGMDSRVDPCDDFYKFACGKWSEAHPTSDDSNSWFQERTRHQYNRMADVLQKDITIDDPVGVAKAKMLYKSCLDTGRMDALGSAPLRKVLRMLGLPETIPTVTTGGFNLASTLAKAQRLLSMDILVQLSLFYDPQINATIIQVSPSMGRSSLPELIDMGENRRRAVSTKEFIQITLSYITGVLTEMESSSNVSDLAPLALKILLVESQTASAMQRSVGSPDTKMTFQELQDMMDSANSSVSPNLRFDWSEYMDVLMEGINKSLGMDDYVMVEAPEYFIDFASRLHDHQGVSFQRYIWWSVVAALAPHTTSELRSLKEDYNEALYHRPRNSRSGKCVKYVKTFMNLAISSEFAKEEKIQDSSKKVKLMLNDIISSFNALVSASPWMDEKTKSLARKKAEAIKSYIGYPHWLLLKEELDEEYKKVDIVPGEFLWSLINMKSTEVRDILAAVGESKFEEKSSNRSWMSDPLDVNAFYGRSQNTIAVPAGILQSPFYNLGLESMNYGAIGSILGHELTHAFDNEGKNYDGNGNKMTWWSANMTKEYDKRAQCFIHQYDNFTFGENKFKINGTQTLAENIADNGGVREAMEAYKFYLTRSGMEPRLPGFEDYSHKQLFFLSYANVWCEKTTLENDIASLADVHTPNRFRVLGTLRNSMAFAEAWSCPKGSSMNPATKCNLW